MKPFHETVCANRLCKLLDETVSWNSLYWPYRGVCQGGALYETVSWNCLCEPFVQTLGWNRSCKVFDETVCANSWMKPFHETLGWNCLCELFVRTLCANRLCKLLDETVSWNSLMKLFDETVCAGLTGVCVRKWVGYSFFMRALSEAKGRALYKPFHTTVSWNSLCNLLDETVSYDRFMKLFVRTLGWNRFMKLFHTTVSWNCLCELLDETVCVNRLRWPYRGVYTEMSGIFVFECVGLCGGWNIFKPFCVWCVCCCVVVKISLNPFVFVVGGFVWWLKYL